MKIFGYEVLKSGKVIQMEKSLEEMKTDLAMNRPSLEFYDTFGDEGQRVRVYPVSPYDIYEIIKYSDVVGIITQALKNEIFRNGLELKERFTMKCTNDDCGKEFEHETKHTECDVCASLLRPPDIFQKKLYDKWSQSVNANNQPLLEVLKQFEDDLNIMDDGYILKLYDYVFDHRGKIIGKKLIDLSRASPIFVRLCTNKQGLPATDDSGQHMYFCTQHRGQLIKQPHDAVGPFFCEQDKKELRRAYYSFSIRDQVGTYTTTGMRYYYAEDEIFHTSKYRPSLTYGWSRVMLIWQKVMTLIYMDRYIMTYYQKQRPPKGIITAKTTNVQSLKKAWAELVSKAQSNPHMYHFLPVEMTEGKGGGQFFNFVDLMKPLEEMQYIEARNEMRRQIGAVFGVSPLFTGDGGSNSTDKGLEITVTNRTVSTSQQLYNFKVFPDVLETLGITDYILELVPNEQRDEMADEQLKALKIDNAVKMKGLGFNVKLNEEGDFEFEDANPLTQIIDPAVNLPNTTGFPEANAPKPQRQNFDGEPQNTHDSQQQLQEGAPQVVNRSMEIKKKLMPYHLWYKAYGDTAQGVGWLSKAEQETRFKSLARILKKDGSVLDVGCGTGHFKEWLDKNDFKTEYSGIDISYEYISKCLEKNITAGYGEMTDIQGSYDYVILSGALNFHKGMVSNVTEYTKKTIESMWNACEKGIAFNFLAENPFNSYDVQNVEEIVNFCKSLEPDNFSIDMINSDWTVMMTKNDIKKIFNEYVEECKKENNDTFIVKDADTETLLDSLEDEVFNKTFEGLDRSQSKEVKRVLLKGAIKKTSNLELAKKISKIVGRDISEGDIDKIIRTEMTALRNKAREFAYLKTDPEGNKLYKWIGPSDHRTTETCKRIEKRTIKGVKLEKLKDIIQEEGSKIPDFTPREFLPHWMCRHSLTRVV